STEQLSVTLEPGMIGFMNRACARLMSKDSLGNRRCRSNGKSTRGNMPWITVELYRERRPYAWSVCRELRSPEKRTNDLISSSSTRNDISEPSDKLMIMWLVLA